MPFPIAPVLSFTMRPSLKTIAQQEGWSIGENVVFGVYKEYFFNIGQSNFWTDTAHKYIVASLPEAKPSVLSKIATDLEQQRAALNFTTISHEGKQLRVHFEEQEAYVSLETLYQTLDALVERFQQENLASTVGCTGCGASQVEHYKVGRLGVAYCAACLTSFREILQNLRAKEEGKPKHYLKGFMGSLLFSLPIVPVWVFLAIWAEFVVAILSMFIVALGLEGYRRFKGGLGKFTALVMILSNSVMLVICNLATMVTQLYRAEIPLSRTFSMILHNANARSVFLSDLALSLFVSLFIWGYFLTPLRPKRTTIKKAQKLG